MLIHFIIGFLLVMILIHYPQQFLGRGFVFAPTAFLVLGDSSLLTSLKESGTTSFLWAYSDFVGNVFLLVTNS